MKIKKIEIKFLIFLFFISFIACKSKEQYADQLLVDLFKNKIRETYGDLHIVNVFRKEIKNIKQKLDSFENRMDLKLVSFFNEEPVSIKTLTQEMINLIEDIIRFEKEAFYNQSHLSYDDKKGLSIQADDLYNKSRELAIRIRQLRNKLNPLNEQLHELWLQRNRLPNSFKKSTSKKIGQLLNLIGKVWEKPNYLLDQVALLSEQAFRLQCFLKDDGGDFKDLLISDTKDAKRWWNQNQKFIKVNFNYFLTHNADYLSRYNLQNVVDLITIRNRMQVINTFFKVVTHYQMKKERIALQDFICKRFITQLLDDLNQKTNNSMEQAIKLRIYNFILPNFDRVSNSVFLTALIYLNKYLDEEKNILLTGSNIFKLYLVAFFSALGMLCDVEISLLRIAELANVNFTELNEILLHFLDRLEYKLFISEDEFKTFFNNFYDNFFKYPINLWNDLNNNTQDVTFKAALFLLGSQQLETLSGLSASKKIFMHKYFEKNNNQEEPSKILDEAHKRILYIFNQNTCLS